MIERVLGTYKILHAFHKNYGTIARPLTKLLKMNEFKWSNIVEDAFGRLKMIMIESPVLKLPDFMPPFTIEIDACDVGVGAILMQQGHSIAFMSQALHGSHLKMSTY